MDDRTKISVIIPTWNEQKNIRAAIASAWSAGADEVIVVDAGSSDQTVAMASESAQVAISPKSGRGAQQAFGVANAGGDVFVFLHADSQLQVNAFVPLRTTLERCNSKVKYHWGCFFQKIRDCQRKYRWVEAGNRWRVGRLGWVYGDQALWVTRDALAQVGGMPDEPLMEDLILSRRLWKLSRPIQLPTHVITSARRWKKDGVIFRTLKNWWLLTRFFLGAKPTQLIASYRPHQSNDSNQSH